MTRLCRRSALLAALLAALPAGARADDAPADAPRPPVALGLEAGAGPIVYAAEEESVSMQFRGGAFVRYGWAHIGLAGELGGEPGWDARESDWLTPGETRVARAQDAVAATLGISFPERTLGDAWLGRHLRLELLGEGGMVQTWLKEDLGAGGVGSRSLTRWTPFAGARLGARMRFGRPVAGFFGLAAFYRHPMGSDRFRSATGRREPFAGDTLGVIVFGGADVTVRR